MKYYTKANAARPVKVGNKEYYFEEIEQVAGTIWGVFQTDDLKVIEFLDDPKNGATPINKFEYERQLEKKSSQNNMLSVNMSGQPDPTSKQRQRTLDNSQPTKEPEKPSEPVATGEESIDDLLSASGIGGEAPETSPDTTEPTEPEADTDTSEVFVSNLDKLSEATGVEVHELREIIKEGEEALQRDNKKGYNVSAWKEHLAE